MAKESDILKKFGRRVNELRLKKGITSQMDLANKAGLDRTYIGGVERGERNVGLKNIEKLAKAIGVSVEELFKF
jgi:transcriptional regulator with XRE-family HTH domain